MDMFATMSVQAILELRFADERALRKRFLGLIRMRFTI